MSGEEEESPRSNDGQGRPTQWEQYTRHDTFANQKETSLDSGGSPGSTLRLSKVAAKGVSLLEEVLHAVYDQESEEAISYVDTAGKRPATAPMYDLTDTSPSTRTPTPHSKPMPATKSERALPTSRNSWYGKRARSARLVRNYAVRDISVRPIDPMSVEIPSKINLSLGKSW